MKKFLTIVATALIALVSVNTMMADTTLSKNELKAIEKDAKARNKQLNKAGWEPLASLSTMENSIIKYLTYLAEDPENRISLVGIALGKNNKIGRENAVNNAITNYAARAGAQVTGKMKSIISSDQESTTAEEIDKFGAAYEAGVNARINGLVKQHFVLVRTAKDGSKEYNAYLSIDESAAKKAREEAARDAAQKTQLQTLSDMVTEFIGEPVEAE